MSNKKPSIPKIKVDAVMPINPSDMKCAPNMDFENGSCYPLKLLIDMVEAFNKYNKENNKNDTIVLDSKEETLDPPVPPFAISFNLKFPVVPLFVRTKSTP